MTGSLRTRLRREDGAAVAEFPMVAVLIVMIGLLVVQSALIVHTRNTLVDAAVLDRGDEVLGQIDVELRFLAHG